LLIFCKKPATASENAVLPLGDEKKIVIDGMFFESIRELWNNPKLMRISSQHSASKIVGIKISKLKVSGFYYGCVFLTMELSNFS